MLDRYARKGYTILKTHPFFGVSFMERKQLDKLSFALSLGGCLLYMPLFFLSRAVTTFFDFGQTLTTIIALLSYLLPLSIASDGLFFAVKRRKEYHTTAAIFFGILGTVAGIILLVRFALL